MADNWDDEDFEPAVPQPVILTEADQWEGEDEDDDVKDDWDVESEDEKKPATGVPTEKKKKKSLKERIAEKEAKRKEELEEKRKQEEEAQKAQTPDQVAAERAREKLREDEEQLMMVKELVGLDVMTPAGLDAMKPVTLDEFQNFATALKDKILTFQDSPHYATFLDQLYQETSCTMSGEEIKKLSTTLGSVANEKIKLERAKDGKSKKKKKPAIPKMRDNEEMQEPTFNNTYDDLDDFM